MYLFMTKTQQQQLFFGFSVSSSSLSSFEYLNFGLPFALEKGSNRKQIQTKII